MRLVAQNAIDAYLANDSISQHLDEAGTAYESLTCQRWLRDTPAKRYIYQELYGDLLNASAPQRILDVGGGLTGMTPALAKKHDYTLVELLAHDNEQLAHAMMQDAGRDFIYMADWYEMQMGRYDVVIANDLFPNVDQRLALFLDKILPHAGEVRLSLTYYDVPRFYVTKRVNAEEYLTMLAWNSSQLKHTLEPYAPRIVQADMGCIGNPQPSAYANGRQVCMLTMRGEHA